MIIPIYILIIILLYYLSYILSLYSSVAYLESEEIEQLSFSEGLSGFRRKYLLVIINNPRVSIQIAAVFKSFALVVATLIGTLLGTSIETAFRLPFGLSYLICLFPIWFLHLIFTEYLPRRRVLGASEKDIVKYLLIFAFIYLIFKPFIGLYGKSFASTVGEKISDEQKEDIIERAIETLAEQSGVDEPIVEEDEKEMIGQIFQLDVTEVREVMVPRVNVTGIEKNSSFDDIRHLTKDFGYSRYPVFEENIDRIVGILYVKDLFMDMSLNNTNIDISHFLREPIFVAESKIISDLLTEFKTTKTHIAIVVDEYGGTSGLITLEDILEEIVGEIQDEHDSGTMQLVKLPDNSIRIDATVPIDDLIEELNLDYETKGFETVGGLIYDLVGSVPSVGAKLKWKDILFEVEEVEGQRIISLKAWVKKGTEI